MLATASAQVYVPLGHSSLYYFSVQWDFYWTLIRPAASASEVTTVWRYRNSIIIFFYPRYQGSRGVWKKIRRKCVGVTITPGSPQTQKNHVAARRWIAALLLLLLLLLLLVSSSELVTKKSVTTSSRRRGQVRDRSARNSTTSRQVFNKSYRVVVAVIWVYDKLNYCVRGGHKPKS